MQDSLKTQTKIYKITYQRFHYLGDSSASDRVLVQEMQLIEYDVEQPVLSCFDHAKSVVKSLLGGKTFFISNFKRIS